ncbi:MULTISPECIES: hypothetical protein [unclassified Arthrobacter]|nr:MULTISPECIES: hypothetical protein [unclassified Arthrobacter]MDK1276119.1 hypothetical protein [Arthrobacter sp. zg.Y919]WIB02540.1 hypothetical protein QNO10_11305 [Arthrobacter sp. zg-Y919]
MEILILLVIVAAVAAGTAWSRKRFRPEIDRAKRIRRANRDDRA